MHVALILHSLGHGGTERQVTLLTAGLVERGHRVTVVEIRRGEHFRETVLAAGGEVVSAAVRTRAAIAKVVRRLRAVRADVAYGLNPEANVLALAAGAPAVFGIRVSELDRVPKDALARVAMGLQHRLAPRARLIVANSEAVARELRARDYPAERVHVIRNGVALPSGGGDGAAWRRRLGVGDGEQLIATAARMDGQKDPDTFLRAAAQAARPGRRFAWLGDGPQRPRIEALARSLGVDLIAPGAETDMAAVYAGIDVFTLTSAWGEAFSNSLAEALAAGLPCVVTDTGDHATAARVASVVQPSDPAALAAAWETARAAGGPEWVAANLGVDQMVSSTEALLLEARRGR